MVSIFTILAVLAAVESGQATDNGQGKCEVADEDETCREGADKEELALDGWPGDNFWGNLTVRHYGRFSADRFKGNYRWPGSGPLYLPAPGEGFTNVHPTVARMCATMCSLMYDVNKRNESDTDKKGKMLFYKNIDEQAKLYKLKFDVVPVAAGGDLDMPTTGKYRIFADHGHVRSALAPMATEVIGDTMIIVWRGTVRDAPLYSPCPVTLCTNLKTPGGLPCARIPAVRPPNPTQQTALDWASNVGVAPIRPSAFAELAPGLRVHSGHGISG